MIRSMYTAATGMEAQQLYMDTIAHNLANVNTNAFKREKVEFQDLMYQSLREPGVRNVEGSVAPSGIEVGLGVRPAATQRIFAQGSLSQTGNPLDCAIQGDGLYQIAMPDGTTAYSRDGQFKLSSTGTVVNSNGFLLSPEIVVPAGAEDLGVAADGMVTVRLPGEQAATELGRIELAHFINPAGLKAVGNNLFIETEASGEAILSDPGKDGAGTIMQGYVESSNVQIVNEMVEMISAQRAYEIVSKAIQVSEDMMQVANNLKR